MINISYNIYILFLLIIIYWNIFYIFYFIIIITYIFILDYLEEDHLIWFEDHLKIKNGGSRSSQDQDLFEDIVISMFPQLFY